MKKILSLFVVMFLLTTFNVFALSESDSGPQNITVCYMTGMGDLTSGDTVILQTTSPTYPGREVTSTTTLGLPIYGVVLGDPTATEGRTGTWIRVQTHGYVPINIVRVAGAEDPTATVFQGVVTSGVPNKAALYNDNSVTINTVLMEARNGIMPTGVTTSTYSVGTRLNAFLKGL